MGMGIAKDMDAGSALQSQAPYAASEAGFNTGLIKSTVTLPTINSSALTLGLGSSRIPVELGLWLESPVQNEAASETAAVAAVSRLFPELFTAIQRPPVTSTSNDNSWGQSDLNATLAAMGGSIECMAIYGMMLYMKGLSSMESSEGGAAQQSSTTMASRFQDQERAWLKERCEQYKAAHPSLLGEIVKDVLGVVAALVDVAEGVGECVAFDPQGIASLASGFMQITAVSLQVAAQASKNPAEAAKLNRIANDINYAAIGVALVGGAIDLQQSIKAAGGVGKFASRAVGDALEMASDLAVKVRGFLSDAGEGVVSRANSLMEMLSNLVKALADVGAQASAKVAGGVADVSAFIKNAVQTIQDSVKLIIPTILQALGKIEDAGKAVVDAARSAASSIKDTFDSIGTAKDAVKAMQDAIESVKLVMTSFAADVMDVVAKIQVGLKDALGTLEGAAQEAVKSALHALNVATTSVVDAIKAAVETIKSSLTAANPDQVLDKLRNSVPSNDSFRATNAGDGMRQLGVGAGAKEGGMALASSTDAKDGVEVLAGNADGIKATSDSAPEGIVASRTMKDLQPQIDSATKELMENLKQEFKGTVYEKGLSDPKVQEAFRGVIQKAVEDAFKEGDDATLAERAAQKAGNTGDYVGPMSKAKSAGRQGLNLTKAATKAGSGFSDGTTQAITTDETHQADKAELVQKGIQIETQLLQSLQDRTLSDLQLDVKNKSGAQQKISDLIGSISSVSQAAMRAI